MLDCIIRNARVIDGTGAPWHRGDIGVAGGKVAMIGNLSGMTGKVEYDAHDHYLAPGFIDIHAHSDETLWAYPQAESRILPISAESAALRHARSIRVISLICGQNSAKICRLNGTT